MLNFKGLRTLIGAVILVIALGWGSVWLAQTRSENRDNDRADTQRIERSIAAECSGLIRVVNSSVDGLRQATRATTASDTSTLLQIAAIADRSQAEAKQLILVDNQLSNYQDRYVSLYTGVSRAMRDLAAALNVDDRQTATRGYNALVRSTSAEGALVSELNGYCGK